MEDGLGGVSGGSNAGLLQNFSWEALGRPPGSTSELTTFEDELEEQDEHSVKSDRKRLHYKIEGDKEMDSSKRYKCRFCTMTFQKAQALGGHMNKHKQERQNESWNRALQLIQQGNPSPTLSGGHHELFSSHSRSGPYHMQGSRIPSEHDILGVGSHKSIDDDMFLCNNAETVIDTLHTRLNGWTLPDPRPQLTFMNQPPLCNRVLTQIPFTGYDAANFVSYMDSKSLPTSMGSVFPQGGSERFFDQGFSASGLRETGLQCSLQKYEDVPPLPETRISQQVPSSMQLLGLSHEEAVHGGPTWKQYMEETVHGGLIYPYRMERVRESEAFCRGEAHSNPIEATREWKSLSHLIAVDGSQGFSVKALPIHANLHSNTRAVSFDSAPQMGGPSITLESSNGTSHTRIVDGANESSTSSEGGWRKDNMK
ncbi:hypothetical protein GOP47_0000649 [Adiantum capillus-veneris]|uniref:C2H2-type domain-containing protein n=1 Tax=Adiantum capillus-veneris TaxID=13818 RepID=A0A9D4VDD8_ADICA|nr:hypothetical protein GOP47_0000649 [Adiantum capillus-veneris]